MAASFENKRMATVGICIHDALERKDLCPVAAARVHGIYESMQLANQDIERLARDQPDVNVYIVEECLHWFPVEDPKKGAGLEEEEIGAPENEDQEGGKMGSVCDIRKGKGQQRATPTPTLSDEAVSIFDAPPTNKPSTAKQAMDQKSQLEDLLSAPVVKATTEKAYGAIQLFSCADGKHLFTTGTGSHCYMPSTAN